MPISMTGFGRGEKTYPDYHVQIDIRSVNNRYNDIIIKMPWMLKPYEDDFRKKIKEKLKRGRIEVFIKGERTKDAKVDLKVDLPLAKAYHQALLQISEELEIPWTQSLSLIAKFPEVIGQQDEEDDEDLRFAQVSEVLEEALSNIYQMKKTEGEHLQEDILARKETLTKLTCEIETYVPQIVVDHKEKLKQRINALLDHEVALDENKLINEVAYYADKMNINEELVRMKSHLKQLDQILKEETSGKKLDFLVQEMNREVNTMSAKVADIQVTNIIIQMKSEIEKIREQIQNLE